MLLAVLAVFTLTVATLIYLAVFKPYFHVKILGHDIGIESYSFGMLAGPVLLFSLGLISLDEAMLGLQGNGGIGPLKIIILFFSMVYISIYLDNVGFLEYCARISLKIAGSSGRALFFMLYLTVSFLTIFTSNDIIILTLTPFIYYFARHAKIDPRPFLLAEFFAANTWSTMLLIGNPTNIYITAATGIEFVEYFYWMLFPTIAGGLANMAVLYLLFRKQINVEIEASKDDPKEAIKDSAGAKIGVCVLSASLIGMAALPYFNIEMWLVSLAFAAILAFIVMVRDIINKTAEARHALARIPWGIVPFVLSFFIIVRALEINGLMEAARPFFHTYDSSGLIAVVFGVSSTLAANVLNNIPMSVVFSSFIQGLAGKNLLAASFATVVGSNLGANLTPIGALAGIMWMNILKHKGYEIKYMEFIKYGLIVTAASLAATIGVLIIELHIV